jgi:hypothetical protein
LKLGPQLAKWCKIIKRYQNWRVDNVSTSFNIIQHHSTCVIWCVTWCACRNCFSSPWHLMTCTDGNAQLHIASHPEHESTNFKEKGWLRWWLENN